MSDSKIEQALRRIRKLEIRADSLAKLVGDTQPAEKVEHPTAPPAPEWDGEVPPIGRECEISYFMENENKWSEFIPGVQLYADEDGALICRTDVTNDVEKCYFLWEEMEFRPIRTKEQRDTEDLARALLDDLDAFGVSLTGDTATALAIGVKNRGWRKGAE